MEISAEQIKLLELEERVKQLTELFDVVTKSKPRELSSEKYPDLKNGFYTLINIDGRTVSSPNYQGMADYLIETHHIISTSAFAYLYDDNHYKYVDRAAIAGLVSKTAGPRLRPQHLNHFVNLVYAKSHDKMMTLTQPFGFLNLQNGILNVKTRELIQHSPQYLFKYILPHKYDPSAECPRFQQFLRFIFKNDPDYIQATAEIFGYCLLGGDQYLHKSFVLYGSGRNGKSTWLEILQELLGHQNVSGVSLANLTRPFSVVSLDGKLANIVDETPNDQINAEAFKAATSGGSLTGAHKGKAEYQVKCNARFLFAANKIPNFSETTVGLKERLYFLKFDTYIAATERNPHLKKIIIANEMPGILNFALSGLASLIERGYMVPTKGNEEIMNEFKIESDSVFEWFTELVEVDLEREVFISVKIAYDSYHHYCEESGRRPISKVPFSKRLVGHLKTVTNSEKQFSTRRQDRNQTRGFNHIFIRSNM